MWGLRWGFQGLQGVKVEGLGTALAWLRGMGFLVTLGSGSAKVCVLAFTPTLTWALGRNFWPTEKEHASIEFRV